MSEKPKDCCNSKCNNVFFVSKEKFFQKDLCDECIENKIKNNYEQKT